MAGRPAKKVRNVRAIGHQGTDLHEELLLRDHGNAQRVEDLTISSRREWVRKSRMTMTTSPPRLFSAVRCSTISVEDVVRRGIRIDERPTLAIESPFAGPLPEDGIGRIVHDADETAARKHLGEDVDAFGREVFAEGREACHRSSGPRDGREQLRITLGGRPIPTIGVEVARLIDRVAAGPGEMKTATGSLTSSSIIWPRRRTFPPAWRASRIRDWPSTRPCSRRPSRKAARDGAIGFGGGKSHERHARDRNRLCAGGARRSQRGETAEQSTATNEA